MKKIIIDDINFNIVLTFDSFFVSKVANYIEIENLLLDISLPSFLSKSMPIIKHIKDLIKCDSYTLDVNYNYMLIHSYINISIYANINNRAFKIGYFFFNNYLNKKDDIYLDISIDLINNKGDDFPPILNFFGNGYMHDLTEIKTHIYNIFEKISANDFFLEFTKKEIRKNQVNYDEIIKIFDNEKEKIYYNELKNKYPIINNNFSKNFSIINVVNENGIFKMVEFFECEKKTNQKVNNVKLTNVFNSLKSSVEDSFIRAFIYDEFFNQTVIDTYLNDKDMRLHDMIELQNITDY